ncbi:MAG: hypothetical protein RL268_1766 [Pseudomonadota bacterium]|jgi:hypothetical protein
MGRGRKRKADPARRRAFDIVFEPMFAAGGKQKVLSPHDMLLRQTYKEALQGDLRAAAYMFKLARYNDEVRRKELRLGGLTFVEERNELVSGEPAMQLLDILRALAKGPGAPCGIAPWVIERSFAKYGCLGAPAWELTVPHLWQEGIDEHLPYCLEDDPLYLKPRPKLPAEAIRFQKGESGNYRGRPPKSMLDLPYGGFLDELVPVKINGETRQMSRMEALICQLSLRAAKGDMAIARCLQGPVNAEVIDRWKRNEHAVCYLIHAPDEDPKCLLSALKRLKLINPRPRRHVMLQPWIVQEAVDRLPDNALCEAEQRVVVRAASTPEKIKWPVWWADHLRRKFRRQPGEPRIKEVHYGTGGGW